MAYPRRAVASLAEGLECLGRICAFRGNEIVYGNAVLDVLVSDKPPAVVAAQTPVLDLALHRLALHFGRAAAAISPAQPA